MTPEEILQRLFNADVHKNDWHYSVIVAMKEFAKEQRKIAFSEAREQDSSKAYKYVDYAHFSNKNPLN